MGGESYIEKVPVNVVTSEEKVQEDVKITRPVNESANSAVEVSKLSILDEEKEKMYADNATSISGKDDSAWGVEAWSKTPKTDVMPVENTVQMLEDLQLLLTRKDLGVSSFFTDDLLGSTVPRTILPAINGWLEKERKRLEVLRSSGNSPSLDYASVNVSLSPTVVRDPGILLNFLKAMGSVPLSVSSIGELVEVLPLGTEKDSQFASSQGFRKRTVKTFSSERLMIHGLRTKIPGVYIDLVEPFVINEATLIIHYTNSRFVENPIPPKT